MSYVKEVELEHILTFMRDYNFKVFEKEYSVNIYLLRSDNNQAGKFDDVIGLFYWDRWKKLNEMRFRGTTEAGRYYLNNPLNVDGTAIILPGQYKGSHKIGLHKGTPALEQKGNMKYIRDANKDGVLNFELAQDEDNIIEGNFKTNIHTVVNDTPGRQIGRASAGCPVIASTFEYAIFFAACKASSEIYGNSFTTTLITENELKEFML